MRGFTEVPENRFSISKGTLLMVPAENRASPNRESAQEFMECLGGDAETFIVVLGMRPTGSLYGIPLYKDALIEPPFTPNWSVEQLCQEIEAGVWHVAHATHPEYSEEVGRRLGHPLPKNNNS